MLLSSLQKDEKTGSLVLSGRASSCGGVCGQCWERGGCMTKHPIYHPHTQTSATAPYLSSQHWCGPCQRLEQKKLVLVSPLQPPSQLVGPALPVSHLSGFLGAGAPLCCAWVLGFFQMLCWEMLLTAPSPRGFWGLSQPQLYKFEQTCF